MPNLAKFDPIISALETKINILWKRLSSLEVSELIAVDSTAIDDVIEYEAKLDALVRKCERELEEEVSELPEDQYERQWKREHWKREQLLSRLMEKLISINNLSRNLEKVRGYSLDDDYSRFFKDSDPSQTSESFTPIRLARL